MVAEPRLALVRFAVMRGGQPVAQAVAPVNIMRQGVRWLQLYDPVSFSDKPTAEYLLTRLLVHVELDPISAKGKKRKQKANSKKMKKEALQFKVALKNICIACQSH